MDPNSLSVIQGAAGAGGSDTTKYVEDVFSTHLYDGTGNEIDIDNGVDIDGEGGMVWVKSRNTTYGQFIFDTERGATKVLNAAAISGENTEVAGVTSFNSNGFTVGSNGVNDGGFNHNTTNYTSWTFRKAPGFFDIVTYTGNGDSGLRAINHNLGSTPAFIIAKYLDGGSQWYCWHKDLTSKNYYMLLNDNDDEGNAGTQVWEATDTTFSIHSGVVGNGVDENYVVYLFADGDDTDAQIFGDDEDESIIKCGSYPGTNTGGLQTVDVGFEPQFVLIKNTTTTTDNWLMLDSMRGAADDEDDQKILAANLSSAENSDDVRLFITNNGFGWRDQTGSNVSGSGNTFIYMAIRRGPMKTPEDATEVFAIDTGSSSSTIPNYDSGFPVDLALLTTPASANDKLIHNRLTNSFLRTNTNETEAVNGANDGFDSNVGWGKTRNSTYQSWMFRRAPGFFDVVAYEGNGSTKNVAHNLQAIPELVITKVRDGYYNWLVYSKDTGTSVTLYLNQDTNGTEANLAQAPDSSLLYFAQGNGSNENGKNYVAYLFASCPGVSKVGSYTGTGNDIDVNCGFTSGARFVMIKRTDDEGDWYVWDTVRGIIAGDDPYLLINEDDAEVTNTDYIDPLTTGFTVTSSAPDALNVSSGEYIYLAIA